MKRWLFLAGIIILLQLNTVAAREITSYTFYDTFVTINFPEKIVYSAGEVVNYSVKIINAEGYVMRDVTIAILLTTNCKISQDRFIVCDIVDEKFIHIPYVVKEKIAPISYKIPEKVRDGKYFIQNYVKLERINLKGNFESYEPTRSSVFEIEIKNGKDEICASIDPEHTHVGGGFYQSGPAVAQNANIPGAIEIKNNCKEKFNGVLEVYLCKFSDANTCNKIKEYPVSVNPLSATSISTSIPTFVEPDAYAVKYILKDDNGVINAIYKNRMIVDGIYAPIIDLTTNEINYTKGDEVKIRVGLTGPYYPSRYQSAKDLTVNIEFFDTEKNTLLFNETSFINELKVDDIKVFEYNFSAPYDINSYKLCAAVFVKNQKTNEKCIVQKPSVQAEPYVEAQKPEKHEFIYKIIYIGIFIIIIFMIAVVYKRVKSRKSFVFLFFLIFTFSILTFPSFAWKGWKYLGCERDHITYWYNGKDITEIVLTKLTDKEGNKHVPVGTIIKGKGECKKKYHWCHNTAYNSPVTYYHKISLLLEGKLVEKETLNYDLSEVNKEILADIMNNHIYNSSDLETKVEEDLVKEEDIPDDYKDSYEKFENTVIYKIPENVAKRISNTSCDGCGENCGAGAKYISISTALEYIEDKKCVNGTMVNKTYYFSFEEIFNELSDEGYMDVDVTFETGIEGCPYENKEKCYEARDVSEYRITKPGIFKLFGSSETTIIAEPIENLDIEKREVENNLLKRVIKTILSFFGFHVEAK